MQPPPLIGKHREQASFILAGRQSGRAPAKAEA
jgi:hypothetical protein